MSDGFEYRVVWKPEDTPEVKARRHTQITQTIRGATNKADHLRWSRTPEAREAWADETGRSPLDGIPPLAELFIERRSVTEWELVGPSSDGGDEG